VTDYVAGKAAWLAEGLSVEGAIDDARRIQAVAEPVDAIDADIVTTADSVVLSASGDPAPPTVRAGTPVRDVVERLRNDDAPWLLVTTARGRLVGVVRRDRLLAMAETDELP
jgi:CBS-domain-containing membrane protein